MMVFVNALLVVLCLIGFLAIFFTSFGTFIITAAVFAYAIITRFEDLNMTTLAVIAGLYLLGEILEYVFALIGAKKLGASNWSVLGAILGGLMGAALGAALAGVGVILGTFLGIFFGAFCLELIVKRDVKQSLKAGAGGVLGRVGSVAVKLLIALVIFAILVWKLVLGT